MNHKPIKVQWHSAWHFVLPLLALSLLACKHINIEDEPSWFKKFYSYDDKAYTEYFLLHINDTTLNIANIETIQQFYLENGTPLWTINGFQEHKIDTLLHHFEQSWEHGIPASYFQYDTLHALVREFRQGKVNGDDLYAKLFQLEMMLTDNYLRYATALQFGATDPKVVNGGKWLYTSVYADSLFIISTLEGITNLPSTLESLHPQGEDYTMLQDELCRLHNIGDTAFTHIPKIRAKLGTTNRNIPAICQRLRLTGELPRNFRDTNQLTPELLSGINLFRANNAIPESDSLDTETIDKLNRPILYYIELISTNLERLRWKTTPAKAENRIAVNIPDFTLKAFVNDTIAFKTRICCGKTQNPSTNPNRRVKGLIRAFKAETPLLYSEIRRIVLNPEWNIPYDIVKNEYLPKLRKNNTTVVKKERLYIVNTQTKKFVTPDSINWNNVKANNIPYRIFQSSGRHNALGRIKFDFANPESVYLHDTNNKGAFKRRKRALSHGCVRVENPFILAGILYDINGFDSLRTEQLGIIVGDAPTTEEGEKFLKEMNKRDSIRYEKMTDRERLFYRKITPTSVNLNTKMPLFIEYYTCFPDEKGRIQYRDDIYYKDENILTLLKQQR